MLAFIASVLTFETKLYWFILNLSVLKKVIFLGIPGSKSTQEIHLVLLPGGSAFVCTKVKTILT